MKYVFAPLLKIIWLLVIIPIATVFYWGYYVLYFLWHFKTNKDIVSYRGLIIGSEEEPFDITSDETHSRRLNMLRWEDGHTVPGYITIYDYILGKKSYISNNSQDQN